MDYIESFRPVFVYTLHLSQANPNRNRRLADPVAINNDLAALIAPIQPDAAQAGDVNYRQAWFAVASWLEERLREIPGGRGVAEELLPAADPNGSEFYRRLNYLLTPVADERLRPEIVDIIKVYNLCLELDYRGYYARPGYEHLRQGYRRRCRQAIEAVVPNPPETAARPARFFSARFLPALSGKAALWLVPPAATVLLYGLYRTVLRSLFDSVIG